MTPQAELFHGAERLSTGNMLVQTCYFLDLIAWSEGTGHSTLTQNRGYDVLVTGVNGPAVFTDYSQHPLTVHGVLVRPAHDDQPALWSTAAGRYQVLRKTWEQYRGQLNLPDFSPLSQDRIAVQILMETRAHAAIEQHNIRQAISLCSHIWASFPGNSYGQGGHSMDTLVSEWNTLQGI